MLVIYDKVKNELDSITSVMDEDIDVAEMTEDSYTLYIYSDKEDLNATITDNGLYCEIMETVPNTSTPLVAFLY